MTEKQENNENNRVNPGYFGHGVVGREVYAKEQAVLAASGDVFGPGVTGIGLPNQPVNRPGPGVGDTPEVPKEEGPSLSIPKLEAALKENPALVEKLLDAELARSPGPRKGALAALFDAEQLHEGGPRDAVLTRIVAAEKASG